MPDYFSDYDGGVTIHLPTGQHHVTRTALREGNQFQPQASAVGRAVHAGVRAAAAMLKNEHPLPQIHEAYSKNYLPGILEPIRTLLKVAIEKNNVRKQTLKNAILPKTPIGEGRAAITLQMLSNMKVTEVVELSHKDRDIGAIVFQHFRLLEMPEAMRPGLERSVAMANITRNFAENIASSPSLTDMLGERVNEQLAADLADKEIAALDAMKDQIDEVTAFIDNAVTHGSLMSNMSRESVWSAMQAA